MLAALLYGQKDIRLKEIKIPLINDDEILLKTKSVAICGTDVRMYNYGYPGVGEDNPRILGHEFSGVICKVGKNVKGYSEGMSVTVAPNMGCGICDMCTSGNTQLCSSYKAIGIHYDGAFAEYVRIPVEAIHQGNIINIEDGVSFDEAALNEPLSCVYSGFLKCNIKPGDKVLIIGAGPIGIMHAMLAKMAGAASVMVNDLSEERLNVCRDINSSFVTIRSNELKERVYELTKGKGLDVCIVACPSSQAQEMSLGLMGMFGRVCFFGGLPQGKEIVSINSNIIHYKQLNILGTARANLQEYRKTYEFIENGLIDISSIVTSRFTLDHIGEAFEAAKNVKGLKNIINFN